MILLKNHAEAATHRLAIAHAGENEALSNPGDMPSGFSTRAILLIEAAPAENIREIISCNFALFGRSNIAPWPPGRKIAS